MTEELSSDILSKLEFAWVDMETTGLEANKDVPLELGIILSTNDDQIVASKSWLIWEETEDFTAGLRRGHANDFVRSMHQKSGLWNDLANHPELCHSRATVDGLATKWLMQLGVHRQQLPMAGSSIGSLDRPFALVHFPLLNEFLHYRNVDISTLKEICRRRNPKLYENIMERWRSESGEADHRVISDCYASYGEYQMYLEEFLMVE